MSQPSSLPAVTTALAYLAAGAALTTSFVQLQQVLQQQAGGITGQAIGWLTPVAILFGGATLARLTGHLVQRQIKTVALVAMAWLFIEAISITTSYISFNQGMTANRIAEMNSTATAQASNTSQQAIARSITELTRAMEQMPANWITRRQQAAAQLAQLTQQQAQLAHIANSQQTAAGSTLTPDGQKKWALCLAFCLSLIPAAIQLALGATSDKAQIARHQFWHGLFTGDVDAQEPAGKKTVGLH